MTKPKLAMQTDRGRMYVNKNYPGRKFISVTTALKVLDKPALVGWAAKMVAEETIGNLPYWTKKVRAVGVDEAIREAKGSPYAKRDKAAARGTDVHHAAEAHILGKPYTVDEEIAPYVAQLVDAIETLGLDFEASEATVANPDVGYAGTLDIITRAKAVDDGAALWIVDIKTGDESKAVDVWYIEYALQLTGLRHATELWLPDHSIVAMPPVERAAVLNLRPSSWALLPVDESHVAAAFDVFGACVKVSETLAAIKADAIEHPWAPPMRPEDSPFVKQAV